MSRSLFVAFFVVYREVEIARGVTVSDEGVTVVAKSEDLERFG